MYKTADFFKNQERAKQKTGLLIFYYLLAILFIICGVYLAVIIGLGMTEGQGGFWNPEIFTWVAIIVPSIIFLGSIYYTILLSKGGEVVAERLGGTPVNLDTADPVEKKLLNIVEELTIASGVPMPKVYILQEEAGINAFAAGLHQNNAVVAVTRGAIEQLNRDQLQGVIAHEFSHILNSDMKINLRLMGVVNGILIIALIGRGMMRASYHSGSRSRRGGGGGIVLMGLIIMIVGYIGVFFGKMIKAAVSRQREHLADASAVQFTRNPSGLAGALATIAGWETGSNIKNSRAEEASHLFFAEGLSDFVSQMFATHPPIEERIQQIDPTYIRYGKIVTPGEAAPLSPGMAEVSEAAGFMPMAQPAQDKAPLTPEQFVSSAGTLEPDHLFYAKKLLANLPQELLEKTTRAVDAVPLVYGLLLHREEELRAIQFQWLETHAGADTPEKVRSLMPALESLSRENWLPLTDLALPALKTMSKEDYRVFRENIQSLMDADKRTSIFEYTLHCILKNHLDPFLIDESERKRPSHTLHGAEMESVELLSVLAWSGSREERLAKEAFDRGILKMGVQGSLLPMERCSLALLDGALAKLLMTSPFMKKRVLKGCVACISADNQVNVAESELLRAVADSLDVPIPPIFAGVVKA